MAKRVYNIMFHTHTISGIFISALLYVIFFAGSISFLRDEINAWERNEPITKDYFSQVNFDNVLQKLEENNNLYGRDISFSHRFFEKRLTVNMTASKDTTLAQNESKHSRRGNFFYFDPVTAEQKNYSENYSLGEFFYRLHFFAQLNFFGRSGYFLSGMVAFFFLFAVLTGVIVHWKKMVPSFYVFRPRAKWKALWTDAHVSLGLLGLPFQFMFAVTGAFLIAGFMIMTPPVQTVLLDDDAQKLSEIAGFSSEAPYAFSGKKLEHSVAISTFLKETQKEYPDIQLTELKLFNYGDKNMHVQVVGTPQYEDKLLGAGSITYNAATGNSVDRADPYGPVHYISGARNLMQRLHYGDFGGYGLKIIYLILGLITCFVIISGVLVWLTARDRKATLPAKRTFNTWLVRVYLAVCLSMYPITAFIFIAVKCFADDFDGNRMTFIYQFFFWGWFILTLLLIAIRDNYFINKMCLILGAILGLIIPVTNGIMTGNWIWVSWNEGYIQLFVIDAFWLVSSLVAIFIVFKIKSKKELELIQNSKKSVKNGLFSG